MRIQLLLILSFLIGFKSIKAQSDEDKINKSIMFDFFMNYEIAQKNGNLNLIIDFIPEIGIEDIKTAQINSDIGGEESTLKLNYNDDEQITILNYICNNRIYKYIFFYDDEELEYVKIAGKKKILVEYDDDIISKITRVTRSANMELSLNYDEDENRINIKMAIVRGDRRRESKSKYFIQLDDEYRIKALDFMELSTKEITYNEDHTAKEIKFSHVNGTASAKFNYISKNEDEYWTKRTVYESYFNRSFTFFE
jgi:hypothetical protein